MIKPFQISVFYKLYAADSLNAASELRLNSLAPLERCQVILLCKRSSDRKEVTRSEYDNE